MSNDNGSLLLHPALVKRDYTPAIALCDITMEDGAVIPKDSDVCILSMTYGVEEGTEQIRTDKVYAVVYFPGGYGVNSGASIVEANKLLIPEFYETTWGTRYENMRADDLWREMNSQSKSNVILTVDKPFED